ncbi:NAD(P)-dependent oxidoreductase [Mumia sp. zg.B21]|uniref:NAD(P)-dependent oxidoreductase n=1 Tax=Mumia sp. zg.B21 TaxID=2855447 RepID=UPI001C6E6520|nr:NAD(P)-dependent oxidoreductase [Mumia sp. zg.B21]MBW9209027.1 NAD(P)-dependent oxidoreductase [Mumia sp. zg.B21]
MTHHHTDLADLDPSTTTVTVLGTGIMGTAIARRLRHAGFQVTVWNRTIEHARPLADDGIGVEPALDRAVERAAVVLTMLVDAAAVLDVADGWLPYAPEDAVWIQSGTIGIEGTERAHALAEDHGLRFVDAPVLGTNGPAEDGRLTILASGPDELVSALSPVFQAYGAKTVQAGTRAGAGTGLKLACNTWLACLTAGTAQAMKVADVLGLHPRLFLEAIGGSTSDSPYAQSKGREILAGDYDPQFATNGLLKDLRLAQSAVAGRLNETLLTTLTALFDETVELGRGDEDVASVAYAFAPALYH